MRNLIDLTDKLVIVAGASSGLGRQTAITLSEVGAKLVLVARREDLLKEVMVSLNGSGHVYYCADLRILDNIEDLITKIVNEYGKIDGFVYSVGISKTTPLKLATPEKLKSMFVKLVTKNSEGFRL